MNDKGTTKAVKAATFGDYSGVVQSGIMNLLWRAHPGAIQYVDLLEQLRVSFPGIEVDLIAYPLLKMLAVRHYANVQFNATVFAEVPVAAALTKLGLQRWCQFAGTFWAFSTQDPLDPSLSGAPDSRGKSK